MVFADCVWDFPSHVLMEIRSKRYSPVAREAWSARHLPNIRLVEFTLVRRAQFRVIIKFSDSLQKLEFS